MTGNLEPLAGPSEAQSHAPRRACSVPREDPKLWDPHKIHDP